MKKILIVGDIPIHESGVGRMTRALAKALIQANYDVTCFGMLQFGSPPGQLIYSFDTGEKLKILAAPQENDRSPFLLNIKLFNQAMAETKPDLIILFQDPYKFGPLWDVLPAIRTKCPVYFISIWDTYLIPHPQGKAHYILPLYENVDYFGCYSKQHTWFVNRVFDKLKYSNKPTIEYIPIGENPEVFKPIAVEPNADFDFTVLFANNNQHRKKVVDIIIAFQRFTDSLPIDKSKRTRLILHTAEVSPLGWNLPETIAALAPTANIQLSSEKLIDSKLNYTFNSCDVFVAASNAEGFGLTVNNAMLAGKCLIVNTTGGLVDQLYDYDEWTPEFKNNLSTKTHGSWAFPLYPNETVVGGLLTHYLYDETAPIKQIVDGFKYWYDISKAERDRRGLLGRKFAIDKGLITANFTAKTVAAVNKCIESFKPKEPCNIYKL